MADQEFTAEELENEEWRAIPGYEGFFEASKLGRIRSCARWYLHRGFPRHMKGRILKAYRSRGWGGYIVASLRMGQKHRQSKKIFTHKLIALTFIGPLPEGKEVNHIDSNRTNNRVTNLEYLTHQENMRHAMDNGRMYKLPISIRKGVDVNFAKLNDDKVREIRTLLAEGVLQSEIAKRYNVSKPLISVLKSRRIWKHVV